MTGPDGFERQAQEPNQVLLEGLHALKHAMRFGARINAAVSDDLDGLLALAAELCPDLLDEIKQTVTPVSRDRFRDLATRRAPASPVLALADARTVDIAAVLGKEDERHVVLLDQPRHAGNAGAVVRVAAAAGARAVLMTGDLDPWSAPVFRAAAGLHYAIDVAAVDMPLSTARSIAAFHPDGEPYRPADLPRGAVLAFGSERHGLTPGLLNQADQVLRLPMKANVSSLNLATAVSAVLYSAALLHPDAQH